MADSEHIGQVIKRLREERGLSKKRLARESLISDAYLVQIEQEQRSPSEKVLRRLAAAMQVPPWHLIAPAGAYAPETVADAAAKAKLYLGNPPATTDPAAMSSDELDSSGYGALLERASGYEFDTLRYEHPEVSEEDWREMSSHYQPTAEGWTDLSSKDQRLVQQLINRLRFVDTED